MRILDETMTNEVSNPDLTLGYLEQATITTTTPAVEAVKEVYHLETIATREDGTEVRIKVVDTPAVEGVPEKTETENVLVYKLYTEEELAKKQTQLEVNSLMSDFELTDYRIIKVMEAIIKADPDYLAIAEEMYPGELTRREENRTTLNTLEEQL